MQHLTAQARQKLDEHFALTAQAFGVAPQPPAVGQHFAATPTVAQTIYNKIVEDGNAFLRSINVLPVSEMKGDKVGLFLNGKVASRTDTTGAGERTPKHLADTLSKLYELYATEFDVALLYSLIDSWAKFPDFAARYMALVRQAIGNDMLTIGWNGTSVAATSVAADLSDMNIGWLEIIRTFNAGSQYVLGGTKGLAGAVTLGEADTAIGGYVNLDVLVKAAKDMLPVYHRNRPDLVCLVGSDVISYQEDTYFETNGNTPTEKAELSGRITKAYAGLPTMYAPFFPDASLLVTPLDNLSIYYQDSSVRRLQKDKPEKNQVQDFNSVNMGYAVEDEESTAFIENITYK